VLTASLTVPRRREAAGGVSNCSTNNLSATEFCGLLTSPAERQEATARCANRHLPVSFKALIRRGSPIGGHAHSVNPLERLNGEIKRGAHVVGIFPNENVACLSR
jgi:Transposase, Mutator family